MDEATVDASALFGGNMRQLRESRGMSQEAFAQKAGVHRTYIGSLERGKHSPSLDTMLQVSKALGVPLAELLRGVE